MKRSRYITYVVVPVLAGILCLLGWNTLLLYRFEKKQVKEKVEGCIKEVTDAIQNYNGSLLSSYAASLTDSEYDRKVAFAAGFTHNMGKVAVFFNTGDTSKGKIPNTTETPPLKDKIPVYDQAFFKKNHITYNPRKVKNIHHFDSMFHKALFKSKVIVPYEICTPGPTDTATGDTVTSAPFILEFTNPKMYCLHYSIPAAIILSQMYPYLLSTSLIYLMLVAGAVFLYRTYRLQAQMSQFRESVFGNITHELKTPLSSLQLIIDNAGKNVSTASEVSIPAAHVAFADTELNRMKLLVDRILSFSKMNREQLMLDLQQADLAKIIGDAIKIMEMKMQQVNGKVDFEIIHNSVILGDPLLLTNAVTAMIDNALLYTMLPSEISIRLERAGAFAIISIQDNGIGIPRKFHRKIFEPFFRIQDGNVNNAGGHGLGLSFVKQVVLLHGGSISLESNEQGTIFHLKLSIS